MSISNKIAHRGITARLTMFYKSINSDMHFNTKVDDRTFENTLIAFILSFKSNLGIECDVQLTKDKQLIIFHDFISNNALVTQQSLETLRSNLSFSEKDKVMLIQKLVDLELIARDNTSIIKYLKKTTISTILRPTLIDLINVYKLTHCQSTLNLEVKVGNSEKDTETGNIIVSKVKELYLEASQDLSKLLLSSFNHKINGLSGYLVDDEAGLESALNIVNTSDKYPESHKYIIIDDEFMPEHSDIKDTIVIKYNVNQIKTDSTSSKIIYISDYFE